MGTSNNFDTGTVTIAGGVGVLPAGVGIAGEEIRLRALAANSADNMELGASGFTAGTGWPMAKADPPFVTKLNNPRAITFRGTNGDKVAYFVTRP